MKPTTIFQAYIKANFWENHWRECRGSSFGIAVNKDEYALKFQKANRQAYFFEKRIRDLLSGLTKYAPDVSSATSAEPLSGLESVPAVESDTQPRRKR